MTLPKETPMIEKVARALALEEYPDQPAQWHNDAWKGWIDTARAVLTALRDPTPEMVEAGLWSAEDDGPLACWQAMITAALNEGEG